MSIELPKRIAEGIDRFTGRAWLLPELLRWWADSDERLFLLTGGPGTGKSMIMAWLAGHGPLPEDPAARDRLLRLRGAVSARFFCQSSGLNTPRLLAESIAVQLAAKVDGYREAPKSVMEDRVQIVGNVRAETAAAGSTQIGVQITLNLGSLGDEYVFDQAFVRPLRRLYDNGYREPVLLLVDALDEAQTYTGITIPDLLSRPVELPRQVRVLATTRNEPRVMDLFHQIKPLDLIADACPDVDDVCDYSERRLAAHTAVGKEARSYFASRLAEKAKGVFLYAAMVLDELLSRADAEFPDLATYPLPEGLSGLYHDFLKRELGKDPQQWLELYEPLLGLIAVAQGEGLTSKQLANIIGLDVQLALIKSKQYLIGTLPDGPFLPFHKSFSDYLLGDESKPFSTRIDASKMHSRIADHYWRKHSNDWSKCDDYGLASLAVHLYEGELYDRLRALISPEWMQARLAGTLGSSEGFIADLELAWRAASRKGQDAERVIVQGIRYALIRTSFNSASSNYPPRLVARALEERLWKPEHVLGLAARVQGPAAVDLYILSYSAVDKLKVTAFTGPVFRQDDMLYRDTYLIPADFWKVAVVVKGSCLPRPIC